MQKSRSYLKSDGSINFYEILRQQDWRLFWIKLIGGGTMTLLLFSLAVIFDF